MIDSGETPVIVTSLAAAARHRRGTPSKSAVCSFCGRQTGDGDQVIAGTGVFICGDCVGEAARALDAGPGEAASRLGEVNRHWNGTDTARSAASVPIRLHAWWAATAVLAACASVGNASSCAARPSPSRKAIELAATLGLEHTLIAFRASQSRTAAR